MNRRTFLKLGGAAMVTARVGRLGAVELNRLKVGAISDEISDDLEVALRFLQGYGLRYVELRGVWDSYITDADDATVRKVRTLLKKYKMSAPMIDTAYLKAILPGTTILPVEGGQFKLFNRPYEQQPALLEKAVARARDVGASCIRVFSFWRTAEPMSLLDSIAEHMTKAAEIAARHKVKVVLENEHACNIGTGAEVAALFKAAKHPNLYLNWDPGNTFFLGGRPYPDEYEKLPKDRIAHMHLKDAAINAKNKKPAWRPVGKGDIDYLSMLRDMLKNGFNGMFSLETHYAPKGDKQAGTRQSLEGLLDILKRV